MDDNTHQPDLFSAKSNRRLLDQLLEDSRLYKRSKDCIELLDFISKMKNFAPFNAMLLQVQKPGLTYAASRKDWESRFSVIVNEDARPLLILVPFGPVSFVYDVLDVDISKLPSDIFSFPSSGSMNEEVIKLFESLITKKGIQLIWTDKGDSNAGSITLTQQSASDKSYSKYKIKININHSRTTQFTTLIHELAHLFLGHIGPNQKLKIGGRRNLTHSQQEIEAESVAYLVCKRYGVSPKSQTYLSNFIKEDSDVTDIDFYSIMKAAGDVESFLKLKYHSVNNTQ
jgi:hypothetical protein